MASKPVLTLELAIVLDVATDKVIDALVEAPDGQEERAVREALEALLVNLGVVQSDGRVTITDGASDE